jgi:hypothetical protein
VTSAKPDIPLRGQEQHTHLNQPTTTTIQEKDAIISIKPLLNLS